MRSVGPKRGHFCSIFKENPTLFPLPQLLTCFPFPGAFLCPLSAQGQHFLCLPKCVRRPLIVFKSEPCGTLTLFFMVLLKKPPTTSPLIICKPEGNNGQQNFPTPSRAARGPRCTWGCDSRGSASSVTGIPGQQRPHGGGFEQAAHAAAHEVRQGPPSDLARGHRPPAGALRLPGHR